MHLTQTLILVVVRKEVVEMLESKRGVVGWVWTGAGLGWVGLGLMDGMRWDGGEGMEACMYMNG